MKTQWATRSLTVRIRQRLEQARIRQQLMQWPILYLTISAKQSQIMMNKLVCATLFDSNQILWWSVSFCYPNTIVNIDWWHPLFAVKNLWCFTILFEEIFKLVILKYILGIHVHMYICTYVYMFICAWNQYILSSRCVSKLYYWFSKYNFCWHIYSGISHN